MNIKAKKLISLGAFASVFLGFSSISTTAEAIPWLTGAAVPTSVACMSKPYNGSPYTPCDDPNNGNLLPVIEKSTKNNTCFYLTDVTAYNNNPVQTGGREVDIREGNSLANPAKVVYFLPYNPDQSQGAGGSTTVQDFSTPIVFADDLYVDVKNPNNNVIVTLSGYYDHCPTP